MILVTNYANTTNLFLLCGLCDLCVEIFPDTYVNAESAENIGISHS